MHLSKNSIICLALIMQVCLARADRIPVTELQRRLGWRDMTSCGTSAVLSHGKNRLELTSGSRQARYNGSLIWLHGGAEPDTANNLTILALDAHKTLIPLLTRAPRSRRQTRRQPPLRVLLDPGHGGDNHGAVASSNGLKEKDLVLDLAKRIAKQLKRAGLTVNLTRRDDTFLTLDERTTKAAAWQAQAFISLHANTAANTTASGQETYLLPFAGHAATAADSTMSPTFTPGNSHDIANALLGYAIQRQFQLNKLGQDRGLRRARYKVLRDSRCPAVLVEVGFLSNPTEAENLSKRRYRKKMAKAIATGIINYSRL